VQFDTEVIGDPVLVRSDGHPAYNFAVVVDDALMEITHVIRGEDHISNTPRQVLLYEAMHFQPPVFAHLALVLGPDHTPLSKRHGATSVSEFRNRGYLPEALVNYLALLGWSPGGGDELLPAEELARRFALENVGHSAAVFDVEKLAWVNRHYLRLADPDRVAGLAMPYFVEAGFVRAQTPQARAFVATLVPLASGSVDRIEQIPSRLRFLFDFDPDRSLTHADVQDVLNEAGAYEVVAALAVELASAPRLDRESFRAAATRVRQATGEKGKHLFHPIRVALTGETGGPELDLAVPAIDRGATLPASDGIAPILGCRERAARFAEALGR
jgi:glutamyl-tRNA synthetase/nondiscriminating glutamyl-tRNA synthetase